MTPTPPRRVLITGGAGFIGGNLARVLSDDPGIEEVRVLDDLSTGDSNNVDHESMRFLQGSILNAELLEEAVTGCTHVVHLAAVPSVPRSIENPGRTHDANATGTLRVLEAARRAGGLHVTLASSSSVYGSNPAIPKTEDLQCRPMSPYAVSKLAGEQYAMAFARCYGLPVMPFRFFNVFGPLQPAGHAYAAVIPAFIDAALSGTPLTLHGDGRQTRDFTYVGTVTEVLRQSVLRSVVAEPTNLAFGTRTSLLEVVEMLQSLVDRPLSLQHVDARVGDVRDSQASNERLHALFPGVVPAPLVEGLAQTVSWFRRERLVG